MKTNKVSILLIVVGVIFFLTISTGLSQQTQLAIGTGGTGGGYYPMGGNLAALLSEKLENVNVSAQVTAASLENVKLLQNNKVQLALITPNVKMGYPEGSKILQPMTYEGVCSIMSMGFADCTTVVLKDSPIKTMADLKGKRVGIGAPGSGSFIGNICILAALGIFDLETNEEKFKPAYLSYAEQTTSLKDGRIDAAMYNISGRPGSSITDLSMTHDIRIISFEEDLVKKIVEKFPFYSSTIYPGGLYKGVDDDSTIVKLADLLVCREDLDEDLVYSITKVIHENLSYLRETGYHNWKVAELDRSVAKIFPMHPGALKYYDEVGIK